MRGAAEEGALPGLRHPRPQDDVRCGFFPRHGLVRGPRKLDEQAVGAGVSGGVLGLSAGGGRGQGRPSRSSTPAPAFGVGPSAMNPDAVRMKPEGCKEGREQTAQTLFTCHFWGHRSSWGRGEVAGSSHTGSPLAVKAAFCHVLNQATRTSLPNAHLLRVITSLENFFLADL